VVVDVGEGRLMGEVMVGGHIRVVGLEVGLVLDKLGERMGVLVGMGSGVLLKFLFSMCVNNS